ncbi:hypothetical protein [Hydrocarboniphaga sp.]|uniref:hypothetical protein n=1 Tax=Hydrocarboniphaga sp. TaxID=2033016 RepID=UPI003D0C2671
MSIALTKLRYEYPAMAGGAKGGTSTYHDTSSFGQRRPSMGFLMETPFFSPQGNRYGSMNPMNRLPHITSQQRLAACRAALLTPLGDVAAAVQRDRQTFSGAIFPSSPRSRWTFINPAVQATCEIPR